MDKDIVKKMELFTETVGINDPNMFKGFRPIQFIQFWNEFRPGDRVDVLFGDDFISFDKAGAGGYFAGIEKEDVIEDPEEIEMFIAKQGQVWIFV